MQVITAISFYFSTSKSIYCVIGIFMVIALLSIVSFCAFCKKRAARSGRRGSVESKPTKTFLQRCLPKSRRTVKFKSTDVVQEYYPSQAIMANTSTIPVARIDGSVNLDIIKPDYNSSILSNKGV